ncbi:TetR/AcrR family transcriptional regulator [Streptomyces sp. WELS2]|uniref:TetR/AcrR family transcriptional regulator n=1 Tax=Streptomyces sp. WELS2 TaxID=2749435 RepID=UPI002867BC06|nr:TetR/AcrR family transcriptional regulator [Streptomyces sp. WELS2]
MDQVPARLGRRERNKIRTKERLYDAALTLFTEQGYDDTSIDQIAERADVARGTFFNYFQHKEDLLSTWGEKRRNALTTALASDSGGGSAAERLRRCMTVLGRMSEEHQKETGALLTAWVRAGHPLDEEPYLADLFARIAATGMQRGEFCERVAPEHVGNALRDIYLGALYRWCGRPDGPAGTLTKELLAALDLMLYGLVSPATPGETAR